MEDMKQRSGEGGTLTPDMDRILCWNVRGINCARKPKDVKSYIHRYSVIMVCLQETKVKVINLGSLYQRVLMAGASHLMQVFMMVEG